MTMMTKILAGGAGLAALAAAAPASAQWGYTSPYVANPYVANPYIASPYAYANPYGNAYGYNAASTQVAAQRCSAAVQQRLQTRQGLTGVIASLLGSPTANAARVVSITRVVPRSSTVRVSGLASSGRYAGYSPYGVGAYGALGYAYQPDLSFSCSVDYRGYVRDVDIYRR